MDERKEPASETAKRKWGNHDITKRYKEARESETDEFEVSYGRKQRPTAPPAVKIFTPSDDDIETIEQRRARRLKTVSELRCQIALLQDVIRSGRNSINEINLAGYRAQLERQKRTLLLEKLKRLVAQQEG